MRAKNQGFSLIELQIVVAIILIDLIAVLNLLRSRMAANDASAVGGIRTIDTASISYNSTHGKSYPPTLVAMGTPATQAVSCTDAEFLYNVLAGSQFIREHGASPGSARTPTGVIRLEGNRHK